MRRFQGPKLGDGQASRNRLEAVAAHALNTSVADRQHQEPLLLETLQMRSWAKVDAPRVSPISWEAASSRQRAMKISILCSSHSVAALVGGASPSDLTHNVSTDTPAEFPHAVRHPTRQGHVEHPCDVLNHERHRLAVAACGRVGVARQL